MLSARRLPVSPRDTDVVLMKRPKMIRGLHLPTRGDSASLILSRPSLGFRMTLLAIPFQLFFRGKKHPMRCQTFLLHDPNRWTLSIFYRDGWAGKTRRRFSCCTACHRGASCANS